MEEEKCSQIEKRKWRGGVQGRKRFFPDKKNPLEREGSKQRGEGVGKTGKKNAYQY